MIVVDTSALISIAAADTIDLVLEEFDVHTTDSVIEELETTAEYEDVHGDAARTVLEHEDSLTVHTVPESAFESSRIDAGEASCALLTEESGADFLITDDLRAVPEFQTIVNARVTISPIVLRALVERTRLEPEAALERVDRMAEARDGLETPIYRRAKNLFQD